MTPAFTAAQETSYPAALWPMATVIPSPRRPGTISTAPGISGERVR